MNARKLASLFQFRFRTLFLAIAFVAVGVAALINASPAWSHNLYFAAVVLLTLAMPLACYRTGEKRAFWAGFALFGWVYLVVIGNINDRPPTDWSVYSGRLGDGPSANLPTSRLTHWIYTRPTANHRQRSTRAFANGSTMSIRSASFGVVAIVAIKLL
jgi:hypothetical protein